MTPVKASSFGHRIGFCRRYPGGWRERSILRTVPRASPTRRAAALWSIVAPPFSPARARRVRRRKRPFFHPRGLPEPADRDYSFSLA